MLARCDSVVLGLLSSATKMASTLPEELSSFAARFGGPGGGRGFWGTFGCGLMGFGNGALESLLCAPADEAAALVGLAGANIGGASLCCGGAGGSVYGMAMSAGAVYAGFVVLVSCLLAIVS